MKYRSIWISDTHLGYKNSNAEFLLQFLAKTQVDHLYLVGDIIDFWSLRRTPFWPQAHNDVVKCVLDKAKSGTSVTYVPGNHDEAIRHHGEMLLGNVKLVSEAVHVSRDGKCFWVTHGDQFDSAVQCNGFTKFIGNHAYEVLLRLNQVVGYFRRKMGFPYWSLSSYVKSQSQNAMTYIDRYEKAVLHETRRRGFDGVICGHIHHANFIQDDDVLYMNTGDWVENCSAIVEHMDGRMELFRLHPGPVRQQLQAVGEAA